MQKAARPTLCVVLASGLASLAPITILPASTNTTPSGQRLWAADPAALGAEPLAEGAAAARSTEALDAGKPVGFSAPTPTTRSSFLRKNTPAAAAPAPMAT